MSFDAESYLNSLEPIGWKLGLERMELLSAALGRPQDTFRSIHVVGTNGKSSVTRMTAAVLSAHELRAGCLVSPHLRHWSERVRIDNRTISESAFGAAVGQVAEAASVVNGKLQEGDEVTQFEISTAAGFLALAEAGVEAAVIEAGLGGRLDATNTILSTLTVLTSIGLDHTEWLGDTEILIAKEKLAVLRAGTTLVTGHLSAEVRDLALETAAGKGCRVVEPEWRLPDGVELESRALYQRENFALAVTAGAEFLSAERPDRDLRAEALKEAALASSVPGRLEMTAQTPPVYVDVAHNRPGAAALAASIPEIASGRPVIAVIGILDDKDARGILTELEPVIQLALMSSLPQEALANSARPGAACWQPEELVRMAAEIGLSAEACDGPADALNRARRLAEDMGGIVLVAGSHYLLSQSGPGTQIR